MKFARTDVNYNSSAATRSYLDESRTTNLLEPIHYIIIVLMFYMGGLTVLIIKYIQVSCYINNNLFFCLLMFIAKKIQFLWICSPNRTRFILFVYKNSKFRVEAAGCS